MGNKKSSHSALKKGASKDTALTQPSPKVSGARVPPHETHKVSRKFIRPKGDPFSNSGVDSQRDGFQTYSSSLTSKSLPSSLMDDISEGLKSGEVTASTQLPQTGQYAPPGYTFEMLMKELAKDSDTEMGVTQMTQESSVGSTSSSGRSEDTRTPSGLVDAESEGRSYSGRRGQPPELATALEDLPTTESTRKGRRGLKGNVVVARSIDHDKKQKKKKRK